MTTQHAPEALLRLPKVLTRFPVSRANWYAGVLAGRYPKPVKCGPRIALWKQSDIDNLIASLAQ